MKPRYIIALSILVLALVSGWVTPVMAQTDTPTADPNAPTGVVTGKIVNQNDPSSAIGELEVMLHIIDADQKELGMLHGKSNKDGEFEIGQAPVQTDIGFVAAVVFDGTTYYSDPAWSVAGQNNVNITVPVFENTKDASAVVIQQMHLVFNFAEDGIEVKQLVSLSNLGERTVKDAVETPENQGKLASALYLLPPDAGYIFFQPNDESRFVKFSDGFADTAPIFPGESTGMFVVEYLLPYKDQNIISFQTTLPVQRVNFVIPSDSGIQILGKELSQPTNITAQNGQVYSVSEIVQVPAETRMEFVLRGDFKKAARSAAAPAASATKKTFANPWLIGIGSLGLILIGGGAYAWIRNSRRGGQTDEDAAFDSEGNPSQSVNFDEVLEKIATLDSQFERGELAESVYNLERSHLLALAKKLLPPEQPE